MSERPRCYLCGRVMRVNVLGRCLRCQKRVEQGQEEVLVEVPEEPKKPKG